MTRPTQSKKHRPTTEGDVGYGYQVRTSLPDPSEYFRRHCNVTDTNTSLSIKRTPNDGVILAM